MLSSAARRQQRAGFRGRRHSRYCVSGNTRGRQGADILSRDCRAHSLSVGRNMKQWCMSLPETRKTGRILSGSMRQTPYSAGGSFSRTWKEGTFSMCRGQLSRAVEESRQPFWSVRELRCACLKKSWLRHVWQIFLCAIKRGNSFHHASALW